MEGAGSGAMNSAIVILQTPSSPFDDRLSALRYLSYFIRGDASSLAIDSTTRRKISKLLLDNVLQIVMGEEGTADLRKRQLARTECFLMLANILESPMLFGNIGERLQEIAESGIGAIPASRTRGGGVLSTSSQFASSSSSSASYSRPHELSGSSSRLDNSRSSLPLSDQGISSPEGHQQRQQQQQQQQQRPRPALGPPGGWVRQQPRNDGNDGNITTRFRNGGVDDTDSGSLLQSSATGTVSTVLSSTAEATGIKHQFVTVLDEDEGEIYRRLGLHQAGAAAATAASSSSTLPPPMSVSFSKTMIPATTNSVRATSRSAGEGNATAINGQRGAPPHAITGGMSMSSTMTTTHGGDLPLLRPVLLKKPRHYIHRKALKQRPNLFYDSKYELDNFALGVDPTDWFEQDKKLGYQKARMWFPVAGPKPDGPMVPKQRPGVGQGDLQSEMVVQEYMQMRALMSYVGDLVMPYQSKGGAAVMALPGSKSAAAAPVGYATGGVSKRVAGVMDAKRYDAAMKQAIKIWTPLMGINLPKWARVKDGTGLEQREEQRRIEAKTALKARQIEDLEKGGSLEHLATSAAAAAAASANKAGGRNVVMSDTEYGVLKKPESTIVAPRDLVPVQQFGLEQSVVFTKGVLRRLLRNELKAETSTNMTLRETLDDLATSEVMEKKIVEKHQQRLMGSLDAEKATLHASMAALKSLMQETIKLQYASLPSRYLLVVDGKDADSRSKVVKLTDTFYRVKRRNFLALAFGIWKIVLVEKVSLARRPYYAKNASIHLMVTWVWNMKYRRMRKVLKKWNRATAFLIFEERNRSVVPLQTLYRRWRERRRFLALHDVAHYNGPLSDIFLDEYRGPAVVKFSIPRRVRDSRRMLWLAAIIIQKTWRGHWGQQFYLVIRKKIVLIQSICRMWPKYCYYRRLKKWAIRVQSWMRRTVKQRIYKRMKAAAIVIEKYVRRYFAQKRREMKLTVIWREAERIMYAAIKIQCRWRIFVAKKCIMLIKREIMRIEYAALAIQRLWYQHKKAYHTFVLMCGYRAKEGDDANDRRLELLAKKTKIAVVIQALYKERYRTRRVNAALAIQCWYRGRQGYTYADILRKRKWASRKLHHWARACMRRRHAKVRLIQRVWWSKKRGRRLRHLQHLALLQDRDDENKISEAKYYAAGRIQAIVHGVWCRRWYSHVKAAIAIQRPFRRYLARDRARRARRRAGLTAATRYINSVVDTVVAKRVAYLFHLHSRMLVKPQALARRFIVRINFYNARKRAALIAKSVIIVQRAWRSVLAMAEAQELIFVMKRTKNNVFSACVSVPNLLVKMKKLSLKYYSLSEPRAGLKISTFLYRLGYPELKSMFPSKVFSTIADFKKVDAEQMAAEYRIWKKAQDAERRAKGAMGTTGGILEGQIPKDAFQKILNSATVPASYYRKDIEATRALQQLLPVQEAYMPDELHNSILVIFAKKFGQNFILRGHKFSRPLIESSWLGYNNYQSATNEILTKGQIVRAMVSTSDSLGIQKALTEIRAKYDDRDKQWDRERFKRCAEALLMASDHTKVLLRAAYRDYGDNTGVKGNSSEFLKNAAAAPTTTAYTSAQHVLDKGALQGNMTTTKKPFNSEVEDDGKKTKPYANMLHRQANPIILMLETADERAAVLRRHLSIVRKRLKVQAKAASKKALLQQSPLGRLQQQQQQASAGRGKLQRGGSTSSNKNSSSKLQRAGSKSSVGESSSHQGASVAAKLLGLPPTPKNQLPPINEPANSAGGTTAVAAADTNSGVAGNNNVVRFMPVDDDSSESSSIITIAQDYDAQSVAAQSTTTNTTTAANKDPDADENWKLPREQRLRVMTLEESIDLDFHGPDTALDLEFDVCVCKIYLSVFERLFSAHEAMNVFKAVWKFRKHKKVKSEKKIDEFLKKQQEEYIKDKTTDHVMVLWTKVRERDRIVQRLAMLAAEEATLKAEVLVQLAYITRYGWDKYTDKKGYPYWIDRRGKESSTYEIPLYGYHQWKAVRKINRRARIYLIGLNQYKHQRELKRQRDIEEARKKWLEEELKLGKRSVAVRFNYKERMLAGLAARGAPPEQATDEPEFYLPSRLALHRASPLSTGTWALIQSEDKRSVEAVVVFKLTDGGSYCDVRNIKGIRYSRIKTARIFQMEWAAGSIVEVRYKRFKDFYRARITGFGIAHDGFTELFNVKYDDGEREEGITRQFLRCAGTSVDDFIRERNAALVTLEKQHKRQKHYRDMKNERMKRVCEVAKTSLNAFTMNWSDTQNAGARRRTSMSEAVIGDADDEDGESVGNDSNSTTRRRGDIGDDGNDNDDGTDVEDDSGNEGLVGVQRGGAGRGGVRERGGAGRGGGYDLTKAAKELLVSDDPSSKEEAGSLASSKRSNGGGGGGSVSGSSVTTGGGGSKNKKAKGSRVDAGKKVVGASSKGNKGGIKKLGLTINTDIGMENAADDDLGSHSSNVLLQEGGNNSSQQKQQPLKSILANNRRGSRSSINLPGSLLSSMLEASRELDAIRYEFKVKVNYVKRALRFGWEMEVEGEDNISYVNYNVHPTQRVHEAPIYTPDEDYCVRRIQNSWAVRKAQKNLRKRMLSEPLSSIVSSVVERYQKAAYVGFALEGLTPMMLLRRAGQWAVADAIELYYRTKVRSPSVATTPAGRSRRSGNNDGQNTSTGTRPPSEKPSTATTAADPAGAMEKAMSPKAVSFSNDRRRSSAFPTAPGSARGTTASRGGPKSGEPPTSLSRLTFDYIVNVPQEKYNGIGISDPNLQKQFKEFQAWWQKAAPGARKTSLMLFNYYTDPADPRTIRQCIRESEEYITNKFIKAYPSNVSRTKLACVRIVKSLYPLSRRQLEAYLRKYTDRAELAREHVDELIDKITTHTWVEEKEAYGILHSASKHLSMVLGHLRLTSIRAAVDDAIKRADRIMSGGGGSSAGDLNGNTAATATATGTAGDNDELVAVDHEEEDPQTDAAKSDGEGNSSGHNATTTPRAGKKKSEPASPFAALQAPSSAKKQNRERSNSPAASSSRPKPAPKKKRLMCSGPEAKAALILRKDAVEFVKIRIDAITTIQRRVRGFVKHHQWVQRGERRRRATGTLQMFGRRIIAIQAVRMFRAQQESEWEQLWDAKRSLMYYYNRYTSISNYQEPESGIFRPLVRDRRSDALIQSWPHLDKDRDPNYGEPPGHSPGHSPGKGSVKFMSPSPSPGSPSGLVSAVTEFPPGTPSGMVSAITDFPGGSSYDEASTGYAPNESQGGETQQGGGETTMASTAQPALPTTCVVCNARKCVRLCYDCVNYTAAHYDETTGSYTANGQADGGPVGYCFPCYSNSHADDPSLQAHRFYDLASGAPEQQLMCCMCDEPATRKCLGILDDSQIDALCSELQRSSPDRWGQILRDANVGGEAKLAMMLDTIKGLNAEAFLTAAQLQQVRTMLERTRAECDECFCVNCYITVHSGGRRATHRWFGFQEYALVCAVCTRSPAEQKCRDCDSIYCGSCYKVFHAMGRKRKHHHESVMEEISIKDYPCQNCHRRAAVYSCDNRHCTFFGCDSCFECVHKPVCDKKQIGEGASAVALASSDLRSLVAGAAGAALDVCSVCSEPADHKCMQCGDLYCSRTWMGNPGCFLRMHERGNRATHTLEKLIDERAVSRQRSRGKSRSSATGNRSSVKGSRGSSRAARRSVTAASLTGGSISGGDESSVSEMSGDRSRRKKKRKGGGGTGKNKKSSRRSGGGEESSTTAGSADEHHLPMIAAAR